MEQRLFGLLAALLVDAVVGDPPSVWRRVPHPVVLCGRVVGWLDHRLNARQDNSDAVQRLRGGVAMAVVAGSAVLAGLVVRFLPLSFLWEALGAAVLLSHHGLIQYLSQVAQALEQHGLAAGRQAVSHVVGRDVSALDESGVARAAVESGAENFSDGVVAPALWFLVGGLAGIALYKAVNTADSMIGHKTPRYAAFGWAAARCDDLVNLLPARLTGVLFCITAAAGGPAGRLFATLTRAMGVMRRDAGRHASPNAGWPETAMAVALGIAVGGPRCYQGQVAAVAPWLYPEGRRVATVADLNRAIAVLRRSFAVFSLLVLCLGLAAVVLGPAAL